ncbi:MAG: hypothetical protein HYV09_00665 [Deltaproteobacteria bacterium]|nr:hypothetical protein [Deltaproteobacteria bacterium]
MELSRGKLLAAGAALALVAVIAWLAKREPVTPLANDAASSASPSVSGSTTTIMPTVTIPVLPSGSMVVPQKNLPNAFELPWGTGSGALGRKLPQEGNPEAPMSVAVGPDGVTWVLDQVNDRIVRIGKDGKVIDTIPLTVKGAQDIALTKDGGAVVLDRLADKRVVVIGPDGKPRGSITLEGKGLSEGGAATGVFVDGKSVYVEREHEQLVKVGDTEGKADPDRKEIPGRPTRDGNGYIRAWGDIPGTRVFVTYTNKEPQEHRFTRQLNTALVTHGIVLLDSDRVGIIYLGVLGWKVLPTGEPDGAPMLTVYCLEPAHGAPIGMTTVPANSSPEETFRELAVLDDGGVIYMRRTEKGVVATPIDCRGP